MKLNLGCGENKLEGYVNIDVEPSVQPDLVCDFKQDPLPYQDNSCDEVIMFHCIEHIPEKFHAFLLSEIHRVLKPSGEFWVSYPEFSVCAQNFIENKWGRKEYWKATIFGRQLYPSDTHVALMHTPDFEELLKQLGFKNVISKPEPNQPHNTFIRAEKGEPQMCYETVLVRELFNA